MCHPVELRPLSVQECAKIPTFLDDGIFSGSVIFKYKQIGNAVPVLLAQKVGSYLFDLIQENYPKVKGIAEQLSLFFFEFSSLIGDLIDRGLSQAFSPFS